MRHCNFGGVDEWTEIAWMEPSHGATQFRSELAAVVQAFLAERGLGGARIADDDIRVDRVYLGPDKGSCGQRVMIRTTALTR
jgi:hypothetical protein